MISGVIYDIFSFFSVFFLWYKTCRFHLEISFFQNSLDILTLKQNLLCDYRLLNYTNIHIQFYNIVPNIAVFRIFLIFVVKFGIFFIFFVTTSHFKITLRETHLVKKYIIQDSALSA